MIRDLGARHRSPLWAELCALLTPRHERCRPELCVLCGAGRAQPVYPGGQVALHPAGLSGQALYSIRAVWPGLGAAGG